MNTDADLALSIFTGTVGIFIFVGLAALAILWVVLPLVLIHQLGKIREIAEGIRYDNKKRWEVMQIDVMRIRDALERVAPVPQELPPEE